MSSTVWHCFICSVLWRN